MSEFEDSKYIIKCQNLKKSYGRGRDALFALNDTDVQIERGKVTLIVGDNGSGKSTLLNVLSGLDRPDEGKVIFNNEDIVGWDEAQLAKWRSRNIGFIFQQNLLVPNLTAYENVCVPLWPWSQEELQVERKIKDIRTEALSLLTQVGLDKDHYYKIGLSGGQARKVLIARALVSKPKVIFADEPLDQIDQASRSTIMNLLRRQARSDRAVLIVSHNDESKKYADRVFKMSGGKVVSSL